MKKETSPYFQFLINHIHETWKNKKGFGYPFRGRDFKELKTATRNFQEWQLMSLWDVFIENDSEWVKKTGHSVNSFLSCLCWLVDDKYWKTNAKKYESKLLISIPELEKLLVSKKLINDKKSI